MIWAILVLLGVPLRLCVLDIGTVVFRNHRLRHRLGNIPVRVLRSGHKRWTAAWFRYQQLSAICAGTASLRER